MANEKPLDLSTLQAGLKRYDDSLADVAKSGNYSDLVNIPSDGTVFYGTSNTAATTGTKTITTTNGPFKYVEGNILVVKFEKKNSAETIHFQIDNASSKPVYINSTTAISGSNRLCWDDYAVMMFVYYGNGFRYIDSAPSYWAECGSSASSREKALTIYGYQRVLCYGTRISVKFTSGNTYTGNNLQVTNAAWPTYEIYGSSNIPIEPGKIIDLVFSGNYWQLVKTPETLATVATSGDYSDLTGTPFEKTVVSNDTTHFYTLSSNDHIEREEGDVWRTEIDDDFKTGLLLVIENSPEFENMPTDYIEAIEVPSSILSIDVFLNVQQSIGSDITTRIFKNTLNEHVIMFKYQDAYIIGDMNLDTGYITYREEYTTSSSPIGINVWQVKYTFKGTHIVWAPKNEDEKFEMFRIRDISTGLLEIAANDYVNGTETCPTINGYIPIGIIGYERMDVLVDARLYNDNTDYVRYSLHNATSSAVQANVHFIILYTRSSFFRKAY